MDENVGWPRGEVQDSHGDRHIWVFNGTCAACGRPVVVVHEYRLVRNIAKNVYSPGDLLSVRFVWPFALPARPIAPEVPRHIASDYGEASAVLSTSEKASAALSRRCLQLLLREAGGTKSKDLADQIEEVLPTLPGYLQKQLDAVRNIGNFAAHPQKSKITSEIIEVEPGEAEWNLDVLDLLFDFYFVQPRIAQEKRDALNKKLADAGKPSMK
jgi:hypothetical protein